jgi:ribosomal protein S18 acetylase RimI-like enzyme
MRVERISRAADLEAGAGLFDALPRPEATARFLSSAGHHLLYAYEDATDGDGRGEVLGFVSGVEMTHPDKGSEMFVYELGVAESARRRGVASMLLRSLGELGASHGCYGMWVAVDADNAAALATYRHAGAREEEPAVVLTWDLTGAA